MALLPRHCCFYNDALAKPEYITGLATKDIIQHQQDGKTGLADLPSMEAAQAK